MALSKGDLEEAVAALEHAADVSLSASTSKWLKACADDLRMEVERLANGPFTLAEAKDSRRPYKRQAWKGELAENRWITAMDTGEHGCSYCDDTQPFLFFTFSDGTTAWVSDEDATACDYLLKPEGGE